MSWSVLGFEKQKMHFEHAVSDGRLDHAYLFSGPSAIGKKMFALELYSLINGRAAVKAKVPAGKATGSAVAESLQELAGNRLGDADLKYLAPRIGEDETKIYIDDIRDAKNFLAYKPMYGPYKAVVIDDADTMTEEASNALLKVLEEPPPASLLILISSQPKLLPATIISRCQKVPFLPHPDTIVDAALKKFKLSADDLQLLKLLAGGRIGWALSCVESGALPAVKKELQEFQTVLRKGIAERMAYAKKITDDERALQSVDLWLSWVRAHGKDPVKTRLVLRDLLKLRYLVSQPQFNHRLAIEDFLVRI